MGTQRIRGRDADAHALRELIGRAAKGRLQVASVCGEAGIGKTSLVADATETSVAPQTSIFTGRCAELDRMRPFAPLRAALGCTADADEERRVAVARLLQSEPHGEATAYGPMEGQIIQAFVDLVEAIAVDGPIILTIDDLHWADRSTLSALRAVGTELRDLPIALILTRRPHPTNADLDALLSWVHEVGATDIALAPLDRDDVAQIAQDVVGELPTAGLLAQLDRAAGNPFFVVELLTALHEQGLSGASLEGLSSGDVAVTSTLRLTVLRRLAGLDASVLDLLRLASVLGSSVPVADLALVADEPVSAIAPQLGIAIRAGVLVEAGRDLRFRHDLVRDALYFDVPEAVRVGQHLDIGRRLLRSGADPARVAAHFLLGASKGDTEAATTVHRAARTIASASPKVAADLLTQALALLDEPSEPRDRIEVDLALLSMWCGLFDRSEMLARSVLGRIETGPVAMAARHTLIETLFLRMQWAAGVEVARAGLTHDLDQRDRGRLLALMAHGLLTQGDRDEGEAANAAAVEIGEAVGDDWLVGYGRWDQADLALRDGDLTAARTLGEAALAADRRAVARPVDVDPDLPWGAAATAAHQEIGAALMLLAQIAVMRMDLDEATRYIDESIAQFERLGGNAFLALAQVGAGEIHYVAGDFDDAARHLDDAHELRVASGARPFGQGTTLLVLMHLDRGEIVEAERNIERLATTGHPIVPWLRVLFAGAVDDPGAGAMLRTAAADCPLEPLWDNGCWWWDIELVHTAVSAGEHAIAHDVVRLLDVHASRLQTDWAKGYALHAAGWARGSADDVSAAVELLRGTSDVLLAHAAHDAAVLLLRAGQVAKAQPFLDEAQTVYRRCGADGRERQLAAVMRDAGLRPTRRRAGSRATTGWESLTAAERDVVALSARGLTNPEIGERLFISRRTVQSHLSHVFTKLGISSRVELATIVAERSIGDGTEGVTQRVE